MPVSEEHVAAVGTANGNGGAEKQKNTAFETFAQLIG